MIIPNLGEVVSLTLLTVDIALNVRTLRTWSVLNAFGGSVETTRSRSMSERVNSRK